MGCPWTFHKEQLLVPSSRVCLWRCHVSAASICFWLRHQSQLENQRAQKLTKSLYFCEEKGLIKDMGWSPSYHMGLLFIPIISSLQFWSQPFFFLLRRVVWANMNRIVIEWILLFIIHWGWAIKICWCYMNTYEKDSTLQHLHVHLIVC